MIETGGIAQIKVQLVRSCVASLFPSKKLEVVAKTVIIRFAQLVFPNAREVVLKLVC